MNIIKLSAINSTNDYLKQLYNTRHVENFTVVLAEEQTQGRGQRGASWVAEAGKNLTFSVLIKDLLLDIKEIFTLNAAVAVSITEALDSYKIPSLCIKWPNDILSGNRKIGGVLIENSIKNDGEIFSVVGIGLNINQKDFAGLPKASSLSVITGREYDKEEIFLGVAEKIKRNISRLQNKDKEIIWNRYHAKLYKKGVPMTFEKNSIKFMGIIQGVTHAGNLQVQLEDESTAEFGLKEIQMLY
jgi:BirA family biotin operon repressor/biotin-[acetyl-CoA-carboxylase] ligase